MGLLVSTSRVLWIGDSISSVFPSGLPGSAGRSQSAVVPVGQGLRPRFVTTANLLAPATATQTVPRIFVNALSGRAYGDISPTIATFLAQYSQRFTDVVIQLGINDASRLFLGTLTIPNLTAQVIAVIAAARVQSPGCNIVLVGPWCHATDDLDVQIAQVNTILLAQVAADLQFIKWSDVPHAGVTTDGTHPDVAGALLLSVPILAVL